MEPETIVDNPIPLLGGGFSNPTGSANNDILGDNFSPTSIKNQNVPTPVIAIDTISASLDTATKKIKGEFNFEELGGITIGQITISPKGILGVDLSGNTTFALDPDTGSATFAGNITAATIDIGGSDTTSFHVDINGNMWSGAATFASAPFRVSNTGAVTASNVVITGGSILIGSSPNLFNVDSNGNLWLGASSFSSAVWRVSNTGNMDAGVSTFGRITIDASHTINYSLNSGTFDIQTAGAQIKLNANGGNVYVSDRLIGSDGYINLNSGNGNTQTKHLDPESSNTYNLGGSSRYWFAINYHFLTKQGGFGVFDDGVEMQDGRILSDTEALLAMQPDKIRKEWGKPIFDFETLPKVIRVYPKTNDGKLVRKNKHGKYIDKNGEEHTEGEDVNAMISILIGATRELTQRIKQLEAKSV